MSSENHQQSSANLLCAKGCGFYGSPTTRNLCSKCYREVIRNEQAELHPQPAEVSSCSVSQHQHVASSMGALSGISVGPVTASNGASQSALPGATAAPTSTVPSDLSAFSSMTDASSSVALSTSRVSTQLCDALRSSSPPVAQSLSSFSGESRTNVAEHTSCGTSCGTSPSLLSDSQICDLSPPTLMAVEQPTADTSHGLLMVAERPVSSSLSVSWAATNHSDALSSSSSLPSAPSPHGITNNSVDTTSPIQTTGILPPPLSSYSSSPDTPATSNSSPQEKPQQVNRNKCWRCNKRTGLLGFQCRCGYSFCGQHRHADSHTCDFDYKSFERHQLSRANQKIIAEKITKI